MNENRHNQTNMNQLSETRVLKALDGIADRLGVIEIDLKEVVTLKERVGNHGDTIRRFGKKIEDIDSSLREMQLDLAHKESINRLVKHVQKDVDDFKDAHHKDIKRLEKHIDDKIDTIVKSIDSLKTNSNIDKGKTAIKTDVFKWVAGILTIVIAWLITGK